MEYGETHKCEINIFSLVNISHSYWHPIIATSFSQDNSFEFSSIMSDEFEEHLIREQRPFLHPQSLQILQNTSSLLVLLFFSSPHSFSTGCRSGNRDSHGRSFIWCSVTHFVLILMFVLDHCLDGRFKHCPL